jgi:transcriptional regulator with XRE-family HTH domain
MRMSTITKQTVGGADSAFARALGDEIRRRRLELGLSQALVGDPLSRAFVSSVESGRAVPSLPSLLMIASRLHVRVGAILTSVEDQLEDPSIDGSAHETAVPR